MWNCDEVMVLFSLFVPRIEYRHCFVVRICWSQSSPSASLFKWIFNHVTDVRYVNVNSAAQRTVSLSQEHFANGWLTAKAVFSSAAFSSEIFFCVEFSSVQIRSPPRCRRCDGSRNELQRVQARPIDSYPECCCALGAAGVPGTGGQISVGHTIIEMPVEKARDLVIRCLARDLVRDLQLPTERFGDCQRRDQCRRPWTLLSFVAHRRSTLEKTSCGCSAWLMRP